MLEAAKQAAKWDLNPKVTLDGTEKFLLLA